MASDWLRHFLLLFCIHFLEFEEIWQKISTQYPLPSMCFTATKMATPVFDIFNFYPSHTRQVWKVPKRLISLFASCQRGRSEDQNLTKLDRKQVLNIIYSATGMCFSGERSIKVVALAFIGFNNLSVISRLGSRRCMYPISEIEVARPRFEPRAPFSSSQELSHSTTPSP